MNEDTSDLPQAETADPDGVQVALRAAHTLWSRGDTTESLKWLRKAAESASDEGADVRSLQLAKAAAELRARLFGSSEPPPRSSLPSAPPGESGAHPISQLRSESELPRVPHSSPPPPSANAFASGTAEIDTSIAGSSRPVTATQYPSHRPRQRIGLSSAGTMSSSAMSMTAASSGAAQRESAAYAAVPSWSADSERRISAAPPPLPQRSVDDYEELEAEPDEEPADDDPGSVWSSAGPDSWQASESDSNAFGSPFIGSPAAPPLPPRGAFADDFGESPDAATVVIPPLEESADERAQRTANSFAVQGNAWDQRSRIPGWEQETGSAWAAELNASTSASPWSNADSGVSMEPTNPEPATQSEAARAKLTARVHHQAVRVSFAPDLRVPGQYVVRPLREGEKAAAGERVALLVALEPGVPLV